MCSTTHATNAASPGAGTATTVPTTPPAATISLQNATTARDTFKNPLNDPAIATVLTQVNNSSIATSEQFNLEREFAIYVPKKLATDFFSAPAGAKPAARVALFFGVGVEMTLFRLREFFANETNSVLITISEVEAGWTGIGSGFGYGISTQIINDLMTLADLPGISFSVEVMAGYSTGYRGVNLTIINELVDLTKLTRLIYLDAWYHHDDHPTPAASSPYFKKNTKWAVDTALTKSPSAKLIVYAFTHPGGVPRTTDPQPNQNVENPPREAIAPYISKYGANVRFIDFEYKFAGKPHIDDQLEKICLARLIQLGTGTDFQKAAVKPTLQGLIDVLPSRGSFGTLGFAGFTDLYAWVSAHSSEISAFGINDAMVMVRQFHLLRDPNVDWTTASHYEMRHRMFVLELGKEPLVL